MSDVGQSVANLSPEEKRALLAKMLVKKANQLQTAPASFAQTRMWLLQQLNPESSALNLPLTLRMAGQIDQAALQHSLSEIVRRHATLRTALVAVEGQPTQRIMPNLSLPLQIIDLRDLAESDRAAKTQSLLDEATLCTFDLTQAPLMRALLIQTGDADSTLHLVLHHTICDGWSMTVLARELSALYGAFVSGQPSPLPEPPIQYADFCRWQHQVLQGDELADQLAYWRKQLQGSPPILELPTDHPRPAVQTFRGAKVSGALPADLVKPLKALSQQEGATLFMTLLAAFQVLLARLSGQDNIPVGSPIVGRARAEVEGLIGVFINNLVLRTDLSGNPTFRELLRRVRTVSLDAYAHQELPFEKIVEDLQPERSLGHTPLFQVMFNMLSFGLAQVDLPGLEVQLSVAPEIGANFDMTLYCVERAGRLELALVYNAELFEHRRMVEVLRQYEGLVRQIFENPDINIRNLSLVTPTARTILPDPTEMLSEPDYPSVPTMFADWVVRQPNHPAVRHGDRIWTYAELEADARALVGNFQAQDIRPGQVVGLTGPRSYEFITAMLAVLMNGDVLLTLDRKLPAARQQLMLETSKCQCVVYIGEPQSQDSWLQESTVKVVGWPEDRSIVSANPIVLPALSPDDPAYIFFTSGTTGVPKGILGRQRGLSHFLTWEREQFGVGPDDRSAQLTGLSFDVVLRDVFLPLTSGATLCLPDDPDDLSVERILPWLENEHITLLHTVPALAQSWLVRRPEGVTLRSLRQVFFAGEPLTGALIAQWRSAFPESGQIANFYGPTETTLAKCYYEVPAGTVEGVQPIGWPLPSTQALVLADRNRLCGIGEPGEIVIRTPFRSLGYLNAAPMDQQRFAANPFRSADDQDLVYYTGDRGRYRPDGAVEILGRLDDQVKIRGMRVEPDEVNAVLARYPAVQESIVLARETDGTPSEKFLVAYVVAAGQPAPTARDLRQFLHDQLPEYMVPAAYVLLAALPLTPNGKVDRRALPVPDAAPLELESIVDAPRTPVEEALVDIWMRVMGHAQVGIHANFFELGGHSLMATQVISRVRQVFKIELPLRSLFETPTVAGLAEQIETALQAERPASAPPLLPVGRDQPLPLSFSQERMWFIHQLQPDSSAYNMGALTRLTGYLNLAALEHGFSEIARRHEDLRTTFATVDGQPVQVIAAEQTWHVNVVDLQAWPEAERESEALRLIRSEARQPFDLQRGPLLRLTLYCFGPDVHLLFVAMHHIISDAWSMGILSRELMTLYNASVAGQPVTLPALEIQYADFAAWQRQRMTGETLVNQIAYWRGKLAGVAVLDLPTDRPRPIIQSQHGAMQSADLPASLLEGLHRLNQKKGVTLFMTTLAAFQVLVQRYTGQTDVAIGVPIANRHQLAIENLIGTFVNTLVLRTDLTGDPTFNEVLDHVRDTALEAFTHQDLSFAQLVAELQPERDTSHSPLFQLMFNVINVPTPALNLTGLDVTYIEVDRGGAQFDLNCTVIDVPNLQRVNISYNTDLFDADTITRFIQHYKNLLESIVFRPGLHISEFPILTEAERRQLLWEWNDTATDYPRTKCVQHLFEEQVERTPHAAAVISQSLRQRVEEHVTYHELNQRANQLARYLGKLGVGPGVYVGISIERSVEMVVGLLGILKAGGAYVPLDPAFPRERLAFMLQDSQVPVLLTQQDLLSELPAHSARTVCLDTDWETIAQEGAENLEGGATPFDLAYILYTSGSTGKPKGVEIPHRALTNFLLSMQTEPGLTVHDVLVSVTTLSFDIAGLELYLPLITGARVVVVSHEVAADGALLLKAIDRHSATVIQATPATWRIMIDSGWTSTPDLKMLCGGEALPRDLANQILDRGGTLWNMYGPTETTIWSSTYEVKRGDEPIHLGHPIANTQFYILDARLQPTPIGVPGELYIGGDGVARGYLKRLDLTAERFLDNPFVASAQADGSGVERIYKTGDLARYRADGTIEFLGRADFQVKVRGFRIELGDIEAALLQHVQVRQAVVVAREDRPGDKRLVGYVIPENDPAPPGSALRAFLKERLPDYMVPTLFVVLDKLPLTPNGKVDRRALPKPEAAASEPRVHVAPRTPLEETVATIWAQVLKIEQVGAHDNFFELGGHSLLATQVVARLRDKLQVELPLSSIFEAPTVAELAERLDAIRWAAQDRSDGRRLEAGDREEIEL
jgi:amino acid adenylation domain-containing protein